MLKFYYQFCVVAVLSAVLVECIPSSIMVETKISQPQQFSKKGELKMFFVSFTIT